MASEIKANKISPATGTAFTLGDSGDTFTVPSGVVLTNNGTASGFGKVLQVVQGTYATQTSTSGTTPVTSNLSASITPSSTSNKVLLLATVNSFYTTGTAGGGNLYIYRDGSDLLPSPAAVNYLGSGGSLMDTISLNYLDSPSSTSLLTYEIYFSNNSSSNTFVHDNNRSSFIVLMEIAG
jgi:hypothetical protein